MKNLSLNDQAVINFIQEYYRNNNQSPTLEEIKTSLGYKSLTSVQRSIISLENAGYIQRTSQKRGIQLVVNPTETHNVPLVGSVACGSPILATENIEGYIPTDVSILQGNTSDYFYLRAQGDSMNLAQIDNHDLVLIKKQPTAENGDKVVALIDDSATIKVFQKNDEFIALLPKSTNPKHHPIILRENFSIQGKVVKVLKLDTK